MRKPHASSEAGAFSEEQCKNDSGVSALSNPPAPRQVQNDATASRSEVS